jgi:uncharacterized protein (UPF0297 family)
MLINEIHAFAREYVNDKNSRNNQRNAKIRKAYKELTGKEIKVTCSTCYVEALYEIINNTKMATVNYELKRGYVAQFDEAFNGVKAFTNDTVTDELAVEYLKRYPSRSIYFARLRAQPVYVPPSIKIIPPTPVEKPVEVKATIDELMNVVNPPVKKVIKKGKK